MFANVVLNRTKGEEIKLTDDEPDDIDNGVMTRCLMVMMMEVSFISLAQCLLGI